MGRSTWCLSARRCGALPLRIPLDCERVVEVHNDGLCERSELLVTESKVREHILGPKLGEHVLSNPIVGRC